VDDLAGAPGGTGLIARWVALRPSHRPTGDDLHGFSAMFAFAAHENIVKLMAHAAAALARMPAEWERLAGGELAAADAVDELLRLLSPLQAVHLIAREPVETGSGTVQPGQSVLACIGAAHQDERQFANAAQFDAERRTRGHLAFGTGPLACIGAVLARAMAEELLQALVDGFRPAFAPDALPFPQIRLTRREVDVAGA
jgi:cytochrome P450